MPGNQGGGGSVDKGSNGQNSNENDNRKRKKKKKKRNQKGDGCNDEKLEKGNGLMLVPSSSNPRKPFRFKMRRKLISPKLCSSSSSPHSSSSGLWKCCSICGMKPPETEEPPSPVSDPNDENFTREMMRSLLETNDFSSKDCNPHV